MNEVPNRANDPRRAVDAMNIVGMDTSPVRGNALTHKDIDTMYLRHIGTPQPGGFMASNLKAQHDNLDELNAPKYSDRVKARRKERP